MEIKLLAAKLGAFNDVGRKVEECLLDKFRDGWSGNLPFVSENQLFQNLFIFINYLKFTIRQK